MALKPCPRCKKLIPQGMVYCSNCKPIAEAEREEAQARKLAARKRKYNQGYNAKRDPKYLTFYRSKAWKLTSKAKLQAAEYQCEAGLSGCQRIACEVHHIQPIQTPAGWDKRLEWENLEALCTSCHNERHNGRFKKKNDDVIDLRSLTPGGGSDFTELSGNNEHMGRSSCQKVPI